MDTSAKFYLERLYVQVEQARRRQYPDAEHVPARDMLSELNQDTLQLAAQMREMHALCDQLGDVASASLLETWIDEAEGRAWFLAEASQRA